MNDLEPTAEPAPEPAGTAPTATLFLVRGGTETGDKFAFQPPAVVGRFDPSVGPIDVDLGTVPEGSYVSRRHAKITFEDGTWRLADLGSSNGTFLLRQDFERIEEAEIQDGDEVAFGNARFVFRVVVPPAEPDFDMVGTSSDDTS